MQTKDRDVNAEMIRVMACLIVIGVHSDLLVSQVDDSQILWRVMLGGGVTYFFILMGFFLFRKKSFLSLMKRTVLKILLPGLVIMLLNRLLYPWIQNESGLAECLTHLQFDYKEYINAILHWSPGAYASEYLWYLFAYVQVVMLVPIMRLFCQEDSGENRYEKLRFYIIGIHLFGMILTDAMAFIRLPLSTEPYAVLTTPAMMAIAGYTLYRRRESIRGNRKIRWSFFGLAVVLEIIRWRLQIILLAGDLGNTNYLGWNTGFAFLVAVCVVIFILTLEIGEGWLKKTVLSIGKDTFVIYLVHYPIQCFLDTRGFGRFLQSACSEASGDMKLMGEWIFLLTRILVIFALSLCFARMYRILRRCLRGMFARAREKQLRIE